MTDQTEERSPFAAKLFPTPEDEHLAMHNWAILIDHLCIESFNFGLDRGMPIFLCWQAGLMAAARLAVAEAKANGRPVQKIGALWLQFVKSEQERLATVFAAPETEQ